MPILAIFAQTSDKPSNYVLGLICVVNIKFPRATYHTIVPSTEELYCLIKVLTDFIISVCLSYSLPKDRSFPSNSGPRHSEVGLRGDHVHHKLVAMLEQPGCLTYIPLELAI